MQTDKEVNITMTMKELEELIQNRIDRAIRNMSLRIDNWKNEERGHGAEVKLISNKGETIGSGWVNVGNPYAFGSSK